MPATRLSVPIVSAVTCAIFLLSFAECTSDIDKVKEDAYKQGYEQGLKDSTEKQTPSVNYWEDYIEQKSLESKRLKQEYLQKQIEESEQRIQEREQRDLEWQIEQLEDRIRRLENESDPIPSPTTRDSEFWEYEYYKNH